MTARIVNWSEVRNKIPTKPDTWKCAQMCEFLQDQELGILIDTFRISTFEI